MEAAKGREGGGDSLGRLLPRCRPSTIAVPLAVDFLATRSDSYILTPSKPSSSRLLLSPCSSQSQVPSCSLSRFPSLSSRVLPREYRFPFLARFSLSPPSLCLFGPLPHRSSGSLVSFGQGHPPPHLPFPLVGAGERWTRTAVAFELLNLYHASAGEEGRLPIPPLPRVASPPTATA